MKPTYRFRERKTRFIRLLHLTPPRTVCPNFYLLAHGNGCMFSPQCSYCYLKSSFGHLREQEVFSNVEEMMEEVHHWIARDDLESYMLNTGNLSDSLTFEPYRPIVARLVETFRQEAKGRPHTLLLLTKGGRRECKPLYQFEPCENVVVSFSVNNHEAARRLERGAAPTADRMAAAADLQERGWRVRLRIDPMILGYDYGEIAQEIRALAPERVTLGSLRAERNLFRYAQNGIFDALEPSPDEKGLARYPFESRLALYRQAVEVLRGVCPIALCEEEAPIWDALGLDKEAKPCNCCA